jgi:hypothetical protein
MSEQVKQVETAVELTRKTSLSPFRFPLDDDDDYKDAAMFSFCATINAVV